jgi:thiamine pyrophosphate-dependent acetolactate synthase large subunit-like protein
MSSAITAGELLGRLLAAAGVDAVYGAPLEGVPVTPVADRATADLLAAAHRRVHRTQAAVHAGDRCMVVGDPIGSDVRVITTAEELLDPLPDAVTLRLDIDLWGPAPDVVPAAPARPERWAEPDPAVVEALRRCRAPAVLAGPGVVAAGAVAGLNAFATGGDLGVLNTWGAKGVFHWRSRHHWATVGLQARDFELGGLAGADLIVATGVDPDEAPDDRWRLGPAVTVAPGALGPLSEHWRRPPGELGVPPLRSGLAAVTQEGWASSGLPLPPSRVTLHYGEVFGSGGLVAADPGLAGYWVARTFSTTELGSAHVPARRADGFAAACALVARLRRPARPVLAAVDGVSAAAAAVLETAAGLGVAVPVEVWDPGGPEVTADDHLERVRRLAVTAPSAPVAVRTDPTQLARMIDVAGPVVAWDGLGP